MTDPRAQAAPPPTDAEEPRAALERFEFTPEDLRRALEAALSRGARAADLFLQDRRTQRLSLEDGIVHAARTSRDRGIGIRAIDGDRVGYAHSEDLALEPVLAAARTAAAIAAGKGRRAPERLVHRPAPHLYGADGTWEEVDVSAKLALVTRLEALARRADPAVEKVNVTWVDSDDHVVVATSEGLLRAEHRPMGQLALAVTARKGEVVQSGSASLAGRHGLVWFDEGRLADFAGQVVERTLLLFDARRPPVGELPVVLAAGASGILLHEAIGHGMEADCNRKGISIYANSIGREVARDCVTIVDSGLLPGERGALSFDDEGRDTERTVLVEGGVMRTYLHDRISAAYYGARPTGSGRRQSFRHAPLPRMRCTYMENGPHTPEEIIESVRLGIVAESFTNGQVQIGAGDFTFYIKNGWLIEDGKRTAPIKDANIIGNGPQALRDITMVANDLELDTGGWTCGKDGQQVPVSQGMPTALVSRLTVGGQDAS